MTPPTTTTLRDAAPHASNPYDEPSCNAYVPYGYPSWATPTYTSCAALSALGSTTNIFVRPSQHEKLCPAAACSSTQPTTTIAPPTTTLWGRPNCFWHALLRNTSWTPGFLRLVRTPPKRKPPPEPPDSITTTPLTHQCCTTTRTPPQPLEPLITTNVAELLRTPAIWDSGAEGHIVKTTQNLDQFKCTLTKSTR